MIVETIETYENGGFGVDVRSDGTYFVRHGVAGFIIRNGDDVGALSELLTALYHERVVLEMASEEDNG